MKLAGVCAAIAPLLLLACGGDNGVLSDGGDGTDGGTLGDGAPPADGSRGDSGKGSDSGNQNDGGPGASVIKTVFLILMENHSWSSIKGSPSAPYINSLVPLGAHTEQYYTPPKNHPSEPNYIWLEAGSNLGITTDDDPSKNHQATTDHLVTQLGKAGVSWKAYVEDISGTGCPLTSTGLFGAKHTPQLFFDDVTGANDPNSATCQAHIRPYSELAGDLGQDKVARYNFITPNLCDDMHGETLGTTCNMYTTDMIKKGDDWLKVQVPAILASNAYKNGGVVFILWDEGDENLLGASDGPIPLIALSPYAKVNFSSSTHFDHSSMLRTIETIFGVPFLRGAQTATNLGELFTQFP